MKFKSLLLILALVVSTSAISQSNFSVKNTMLQWQLVFNDSTTTLNKQLKKSGFLITNQANEITFTKEFTTNDLKKYGYVKASFPSYINNGTITGIIDVKGNRYRVTITNIKVLNNADDNYSNLEEHVVRKDNIKQQPHHIKTLDMLNTYFISLFTISDKKDDW